MPIQFNSVVFIDGSVAPTPIQVVVIEGSVFVGSIRYLSQNRLLEKPQEGAQRVRIVNVRRRDLVMDGGTTYYVEKASK